jgi:antitoxin (DNA-binding transcriptional repressor) of toxin-antitoxin stability system
MSVRQNVTEVARNFADFLNRVAYRGETFVLLRGGKPVAELRPVIAGRRLGELPELIASLPRLSEEDASAFEQDLDAAREELGRIPIGSPWES